MMNEAAKMKARSSTKAEIVALVAAAVLLLLTLWFRGPELLDNRPRLYTALLTTIGFAIAARLARGVNTFGALAGASIALGLVSRDLRIFWVLLIVFFVTLAATRVGGERKRQLRVAEAESGRSAAQVMANLGIAAFLLVLPSVPFSYVLALAALAEVAADTTSSEIGTALSSEAVLITTWRRVPSGTDGGVSLSGTAAGVIAALITSGFAAILGLVSISTTLVIAGAGTAGMIVDSFLGALLERRGYLNNDIVNFLGTAAAALVAWILENAIMK
jgi:uncharacterized protein (TIGR00297 family)